MNGNLEHILFLVLSKGTTDVHLFYKII